MIQDLLDRLSFTKKTGEGRWLARCPAHDDRSPSLDIREAEDGRILIHCFAGCGAVDILDAVGMDFGALFPDKDTHRYIPIRKVHKVSTAAYNEALLEICEAERRKGAVLSEKELEQELQAYKRTRGTHGG